MSKRTRTLLLVALALALGLAAEVVFEMTREPEALLQVVNNGASPMEGVTVRCGPHTYRLGTIEPKGRASAYIGASKPTTVVLDYKQKRSVMEGIPLEGVDPRELLAEEQKLVIEVQEDGFRRYPEDHPGWWSRNWRRFVDWLREL